MWHSYEPRGNKVYQQQLIRWLQWWCAAQHILRNPNETPVHSGNIRSGFISDGNPIDGRGLLWLIRLQHFIYCIFISVRLSRQNNRARKTRTRVQVVPEAIVCTGYDTVRHFAGPINRTASLQIALVYCIPLWPIEPQEKWLCAFDSTLQKFTPVISFGSSSLRVAVRLFGGERRGVELWGLGFAWTRSIFGLPPQFTTMLRQRGFWQCGGMIYRQTVLRLNFHNFASLQRDGAGDASSTLTPLEPRGPLLFYLQLLTKLLSVCEG